MAHVRLEYDRRQGGWAHTHVWHGAPIRTHRHAELELNLVLRGRGTYILEDRRYELVRNSLVWFFAAQNHVLTTASDDFSMIVAVFSTPLVREYCTGDARVLRSRNPKQSFCRRIDERKARRLRGLFEELAHLGDDTARYRAGLAYAMLSSWEAYSSASEILAAGVLHPSVERAARLIQDGHDDERLPEIASRVGLSASRLSRLFVAQMGVPLNEFRNARRLERFLELHQAGGSSNMLDLALRAGFGSYAQFYRVFKRAMGCGPREIAARSLRIAPLAHR